MHPTKLIAMYDFIASEGGRAGPSGAELELEWLHLLRPQFRRFGRPLIFYFSAKWKWKPFEISAVACRLDFSWYLQIKIRRNSLVCVVSCPA